MKMYKVMIIDDEPIIVEGFQGALHGKNMTARWSTLRMTVRRESRRSGKTGRI